LVVLLFVALSDAVTDWTALRQQAILLDPWARTAVFVVFFLVWGWTAGHALYPVWHQPAIAFLVRQPLTWWQWVVGLLPSLAVAFVPVVAIWWLVPHYANSVIHYLGFVGLSWPLILGFSFAVPSSIIVAGTGTTSLAVLLFAYGYFPFAAYVACIVTILQLPLGVAFIRRQIAPMYRSRSGHLSSAGAALAIARRDLRCLSRIELATLLFFALFGAVVALIMLALRVNGAIEGREAFLAGCILFSLVASMICEILERLKAHLGKEVMRHRWPVTYSERGLALVGLVSLLAAPSGVLIGSLGSSMGSRYLLLFCLFIGVTVTLCAAFFSRTLGATTPSTAYFLLIAMFHNILVFWLPPWAYAIVALPAVFINCRLISSGLRRFTVDTERGIHGRLA
jgi:hypothetical protein